MTQERILITGAAGNVATLLRPRLARPGRTLRLLDVREPEPAAGDPGAEEVVVASVTDTDRLVDACRDIDAIVHLGGQSREATMDEMLARNVLGTYSVFEAARRAGVTRVVIASSNHAVGFHRRDPSDFAGLPADASPRPDTLYGWSKTAGESLGRLYADRFGMDVTCLRIGMWSPEPFGLRGLAVWLSPDDGARLIEACVATDQRGFRIVWGVSRNSRGWWSLAAGEEIGYVPQDNAESYAAALIAEHGEPDFDSDPDLTRVGGPWCDIPLGEPV